MRRLIASLGLAALVSLPVPALAGGGGGGGRCARPITDGRTTTIVIDGTCFMPTVARVPVGATVRWVNRSGIDHNVGGPPQSFFYDLSDNASMSVRFARAGYLPYACTFHPTMTGLVIVGTPGTAGIAPATVVAEPSYRLEPAQASAQLAPAAPQNPAPPAAQAPATTQAAHSKSDAGTAVRWIAAVLLTLAAAGLVLRRSRRRTTVGVPV